MAQYNVKITQFAEDDLRDIGHYIAIELSGPIAATKMIASIKKSIWDLANMPDKYPLVGDERLAVMGYRKLVIKNYVVFFMIDENTKTVYVERILYARRDWLHIL